MSLFDKGLLIGRSSLTNLSRALEKALGEWGGILPYLDRFSSSQEMELIAAISYILGKPVRLTPTLQVSIARDFVESQKRLLVSDEELLAVKEYQGEAYGEEVE